VKQSEDYILKALENITADRKRLETLYDELNEQGAADPFVRQAISDNLVKIVDSLTKQTGQVVELAKLKQKLEKPETTDNKNLTKDDKDSLFDVIEAKPLGRTADA